MGPPRHGVLSVVVLPIGVPIRVNSVVSRVLYMGHNQPLEALHACLSSGLRADIHSSLSPWELGTGTGTGTVAVSRQVGTDACETEAL